MSTRSSGCDSGIDPPFLVVFPLPVPYLSLFPLTTLVFFVLLILLVFLVVLVLPCTLVLLVFLVFLSPIPHFFLLTVPPCYTVMRSLSRTLAFSLELSTKYAFYFSTYLRGT